MEAKICPDGSGVGRQGPNCEFAPCPEIAGNDSDSHGCKGSVGYSWCEEKQKCLRPWEESCTFTPTPQLCTDETKICPDGTDVGRDPDNNCYFFPCPKTNYNLYGKITIGPICPVEPCNMTFDYSAIYVNIYDSFGKNRIKWLNADVEGNYKTILESGTYLVGVTDLQGNAYGLPGSNSNQTVSITGGNATELNFNIDTGIR